MSKFTALLFSVSIINGCLAAPNPLPTAHVPKKHDGIVSIPLARRTKPLDPNSPKAKRLAKSKRSIAQIGLGTDVDIAYAVSMAIGGSPLEFQLDTGSADLWSANTQCTRDACEGASGEKYSQSSTFIDTGLPLDFYYGSVSSPTVASGELGLDTVSFAGFTVQNGSFTSVSQTNNSIVQTYSGIFGVSFPYISNAVATIFAAEAQLAKQNGQTLTSQQLADGFVNTAVEYGGPITRLVASGSLDRPMYSVTIQRELIENVGNAGVLTLGGLPSAISDADITYVDVTPLPASNLGIFDADSASIVGNIYQNWNVKVDKITVNGQVLADSTVVPSSVTSKYGNLALIDSGTTSMLLPSDQVEAIYKIVGFNENTGTIPCDQSIQMVITMGGKDFPINPVDWLQPRSTNSGALSDQCNFLLDVNDTPTDSNPLSSIFGDVLMRNVLTVYNFGSANATNSGAQIGFLSTTNLDQAEALYTSIYPDSLDGQVAPNFTPAITVIAPGTQTVNIPNPIGTFSAGQGNGGSNSGSSGSGNAAATGFAINSVLAGLAMIVAGLLI